VMVVPKDTAFCVNARLRRVCLLDSPPGPLSFEERFTGTLPQLARMVNYLNRTFPIGTPLEDLDIDIIPGITGPGVFRRPVVELWGLRLVESLIVANVVSPGATAGVSSRGRANYKHFLEVWIDTLVDEYERESSRSPLDRGILFGENRFLDTCFAVAPEGGAISVSKSTATVSPLFRVPLNPGLFDIGGTKTLSSSKSASTRSRALETVTRWNAIERQVANLLSNTPNITETALSVKDPKVLGVLLNTWRKLPADDVRNVDFDKTAAMLQLEDGQKRLLLSAEATNLSGVAEALLIAPEIDRQNAEVKRFTKLFKDRKLEGDPPDSIKFPITAKDTSSITGAIGTVLAANKSSVPDY